MSRVPVREALARLEREGLAASPHRGYVVTALSGDEIEELFDLRATLEPELLKAAIPRMTSADLGAAAAELAAYNEDIDKADVASWGEHNLRFHMALYAPSGRRRTLDIVRGLLINTDRYTRLVLTLGAGVNLAKDDHGGLFDLCKAGAVTQAIALARDHIERARSDLRHLLEKDRQQQAAAIHPS
ncbi:GntR family transcriptional regulator [Sphingosinicella rhizophila]|uniref:GntR family transcriptional regulator n=1 Tax=Sphingosinicella rhizophila TaxID=3050082 RepID=A0ABU3Q5M7_9SPHN|nr:GntR family transcriptional regulator [Sphingosinicella sp. GR2756]MDT9598710.1 GntR family transcriptional regulator [Sphingosinicella sp. GR2756]